MTESTKGIPTAHKNNSLKCFSPLQNGTILWISTGKSIRGCGKWKRVRQKILNYSLSLSKGLLQCGTKEKFDRSIDLGEETYIMRSFAKGWFCLLRTTVVDKKFGSRSFPGFFDPLQRLQFCYRKHRAVCRPVTAFWDNFIKRESVESRIWHEMDGRNLALKCEDQSSPFADVWVLLTKQNDETQNSQRIVNSRSTTYRVLSRFRRCFGFERALKFLTPIGAAPLCSLTANLSKCLVCSSTRKITCFLFWTTKKVGRGCS